MIYHCEPGWQYTLLSISAPARTAAMPPVPADCMVEKWTPAAGWSQLGAPLKHVVGWGVFHYTRMFRSREFGAILIKRGGRLVHRTTVIPAYHSFPFMAPDDLQLGDTWTDVECRGRGLATAGIQLACAYWHRPERTFWYIARTDNTASIRAALKAGLENAAAARHCRPRGAPRVLGYYELADRRPGGPRVSSGTDA